MTSETAVRPASPVGLLVLGMHRSGTSALTGLLERLGIPVAGELLPAEAYNEKGLYENRAVNAFHNRLLAHLGSRWDDPMPVSNGFVETRAGEAFAAELAGIISSELLAEAPIFAVKDPRMSRFVPLWRAAMARLGAEPMAVLPLRHPLDVAASLARRDGFVRAKSLLLWLDHTLAGEAATRDLKRTVLLYDDLLADWRGAADRISTELGLAWPKERGRVEAEVDAFLTPDLRHHTGRAAIGEGTRLDALTGRAWEALTALAAHARDSAEAAGARETLDAVRRDLGAATSVLSPYVAWEFAALGAASGEAERLALQVSAQDEAFRQSEATFRRALDEAETRKLDERRALEERWSDERREEAKRRSDERQDEARRWNDERAALGREIAELGSEVAPLRALPLQVHALETERNALRHEVAQRAMALEAIHRSTSWRALQPIRSLAGALPPGARNGLRRAAKGAWWTLTPWRMGERRRVREAFAALAASAASAPVSVAAPGAAGAAAAVRRLGQPALRVFQAPTDVPRLSMVTDSINEGSLFGGVATALIFSVLLAERTGRRLRIVTRTQAPATENVATVLRAHGIEHSGNIEFAFADIAGEGTEIDVAPDEIFVTTSWWTTRATADVIAEDRIVYILQEDERMFYPFGDEALVCAETMSHPGIVKVVNSGLLHRHLVEDGILSPDTAFFEPAFPDRIYFPEPRAEGKRRFFFYARPNNPRNLYARGVETIERAIAEGVLDPAVWDIHFVGKDLAPMVLAGSVKPILMQNMAWEDYAAFTRSVDLGLTLMYTPHPSYPPLDIAACGGVAVTNRFGVKQDLSNYSASIVCAEGEVETLVEALRAGATLALDAPTRAAAFAGNRILRDWPTAFAPVLDDLSRNERLVR
ncbi:sulfotransferase family protein [Aureimonas pseudogalii]|uniref:Uncharacterized protein n=1 Tax=Aureimonas pseudogalii TaxID=1744844 RepID=A0A7W6H5E4_9HYPH|nr:hypothetical protein [Aureimonas pseudogalii]MBB3998889.1 hypothetical protein [Aureimonas pseudogalii]